MKFLTLFLLFMFFHQVSYLRAETRNDIVILGSYNGSRFNNLLISRMNGSEVNHIPGKESYDFKNLTTGDFNGDGISEIAVFCKRPNSDITDQLIVFNFDGSVFSNFYAGEKKTNIKAINNITAADLNDDGIDEIVVSCSENGDPRKLFNNLIAFSGSGTYLYSNFDYPGGSNFTGIASGNFDPKKNGDEIVIYEPYHQESDRIIIFSQNLAKADFYCETRQDEDIFFKLSSITGGDIDGDGLDEIVATDKNRVVIFKDKTYLKDFSSESYNLLGVTCRDFDNDGVENIAIFCSPADINPRSNDRIIIYKSKVDGDVLSDYRYSNLGYTAAQVIAISSGTFEPSYPLLYLNKSKIQKLDTSHPFYSHEISKAVQHNFRNSVDEISPWYTDSGADRNLHFKLAKLFKYIGILYQTGESDPAINECVLAFNQYAIKFEKAFNHVNGKYPRQIGVFIENLLHESYWLEEICWAYDLLYDKMSQPVRINIRNKLLRLAAKRQIEYSPGRNNHANGHNFAIAAAGFVLNDKKLLALAYKGTDICEDPNLKGEWRGLYEQLQSSDSNDPVTFDYLDVKNAKPQYTNIGIYLPDYSLYEGSISYSYHDIEHLVKTAAMADNNNYQNIDESYRKIDQIAKTFISTVFPFQKDQSNTNLNFPALSDDILQGLKTVSYLEILHSKYYNSSPSPYATILSKNMNTFENFIFSNKNYSSKNDDPINKSQNMADAGWGIIRSGQDIDDPNKLMILMDYGPYGGNNHGHSDRFNIILYSNFDNDYKQLIGDIGNLRKPKNKKLGYYNHLHNGYVRSTISHNTILINNNRQADPNRELDSKTQPILPIYGDGVTIASEASYANKKCSVVSFDGENSDSLQYISAKSGFNSCYGPDYSVERTVAMIADKYIIDIVNIEKKPGATVKFIDWIIRGPNSAISTDQSMNKALKWDWEQSPFAIPNPNESYNYLYDIDTTKSDIGANWKTQWIRTSGGSDTLLQINGINTGNQRLMTALSPDSSEIYNLDPLEIKANLIIRKYGISDDEFPEFLSIIRPIGTSPVQNVSVVDSILVLKNRIQKTYIFDFKNKVLH